MNKEELEKNYLYKNWSIRPDYYYRIQYYEYVDDNGAPLSIQKIVIGKILNFGMKKYVIESINENGIKNLYIIHLNNIYNMMPYMEEEKYMNKINKRLME